MTLAEATTKAVTPFSGLPAALEWPNAFAQSLMQAQRAQWQALISWQQSVAAINQELWDEWIARWAGGVPIDA